MKKYLFFICISLLSLKSIGQQTSNRSEDQAKHLSDSLYQKLIAGSDFKTLVAKFSEDPGSNRKGGLYTGVKMGAFVAEFEETAVRLKLHEISKPFLTQYGYHIIQVVERSGDTYAVRHILITFSN